MTLRSIIDPKKRAQVRAALRKGDPSMLKKKKVARNPLVEQPTAQKQLTPKEQEKLNQELFEAARNGDTQKVADLIQRGADVNKIESCFVQEYPVMEREISPLMLASMKDHTETVELLLQSGADVNARDNSGRTPLIIASYHGRNKVVELLIQNGADINDADNLGSNSLATAYHNSNTQTADLLKKHGAKE
jgi:ankyrin repeat protein